MNFPFRTSRFVEPEKVRAEFPETQQMNAEVAIGQIIHQANKLSTGQIEEVLEYQKEHNVRFGEAAVILGYLSPQDINWALAQQFQYHYAADHDSNLNPELVVATKPFTKEAETFRTIRSHLIMKLFNDESQSRALAVVSPESGDGKTYFAANLAIAFSQLPGRTLLLDADMRNPRIHDLFKLSNRGPGLSTVLSGRVAPKAIQSVKELPNLYVLPVGAPPPNPLELLERNTLGMLMKELKRRFDRIIVDTPAATYGTDSAVISAKCGASLIIARNNASRVHALQDLVSTIKMGNTQIVGTVINQH